MLIITPQRDGCEIFLWIGQSEWEFHPNPKPSNAYATEKQAEMETWAFLEFPIWVFYPEIQCTRRNLSRRNCRESLKTAIGKAESSYLICMTQELKILQDELYFFELNVHDYQSSANVIISFCINLSLLFQKGFILW